ncbi:RNA-binding protein spenito-like [Armigeres subalbatus]
MAHRAKVELSGQYIGKFQCKIGYGKATPTTRIWVGGLGAWTSITQLEREFDRFGAIKKIEYNKGDTQAYILYDSIDAATTAVKGKRGFPLGATDRRIRIDFADNGTTPSQSAVEVLRKAENIAAAPTTNIRKAVHHTRKIHRTAMVEDRSAAVENSADVVVFIVMAHRTTGTMMNGVDQEHIWQLFIAL